MLTRTHTLKLEASSEIAATIDSSPSKTSAGPVEHFLGKYFCSRLHQNLDFNYKS